MTSNFENDRLRGKRYIRLVRCSTKGQADTSVSDQLGVLDAFAKPRGMVHVDDLVLEGLSVSMPREFVDALIARKRLRNDFDVLLVQDTSRLTRGGAQYGAKLEYDLRAAGIMLIFALDGVPQDDFGEVMRGMQYLSGRQTAKAISFTATRGAQSALEQNRVAYCRRPPYAIDRVYVGADGTERYLIRNLADGSQLKLDPITEAIIDRFDKTVKAYNHNRKQKDERIVLVPGHAEQVEVVRRMFRRRFMDGWGLHRIAQELNDMGIVGPTGAGWHMESVKNIFQNPIYTGRSIANLFTTGIYNMLSPSEPKRSTLDAHQLNGRKRPPRRVRPREEWVESEEPKLVDFLEPRIRALAIEAQDYWLAAKAGGYTPTFSRDRHRDSPYLLKGILTAKQGGHSMTGKSLGRSGKRKRYYAVNRSSRCPRSADKVMRKTVMAEPIEKLILNAVRITLLSAPALKARLKREIEAIMKESGGSTERLTKLTAQLDDLKRRQAFIIKNVTLLGEDEAGRQLADLARQRDEAQRSLKLEELSGARPSEDADAVAERLVVMLKDAGRRMDIGCSPALRSLLQLLVAKAEVDLATGNLDLELRLPKSALAAEDLMCLVTGSSSKPTDETHQQRLLLLSLRAIRLPRWYVAYCIAA